MEQIDQLVTVALWLLGSFGAVVTLLLSWIAVQGKNLRTDNRDAIKEFRESWVRHDVELKEHRKELHEMREDTKVSIELIKQEQQHNKKRFEFLEDKFFKMKGKRGGY